MDGMQVPLTVPLSHREWDRSVVLTIAFALLKTEGAPRRAPSSVFAEKRQISRITGIISGRRLVLFWIYRFRSVRIFSLMTP